MEEVVGSGRGISREIDISKRKNGRSVERRIDRNENLETITDM